MDMVRINFIQQYLGHQLIIYIFKISTAISEIKLRSGQTCTISMSWANLVHLMQLKCNSTSIEIN